MMTANEMQEYFEANGQMPSLEEMHKAPIGWFPIKPSNPSKLKAHKFIDGEWIELPYVKYVSWPEKFPT